MTPLLRAVTLWLVLLGLFAAAIATRGWWVCVAAIVGGLITVLAVCGNTTRDL